MPNEQGATRGRLDQADLWDRLNAFVIDSGDPAFTFEQRLQRDNGWAGRYTARAIQEYKRFVYLAVTAPHPVAPSDQVDQVWHLHLTYTRSYWDGLCGQVLGDALHHGPTHGGIAEADKYRDWYERTLASYWHTFGERPPEDLWPSPEQRFRNAARFQRVSRTLTWTIPRLR